MAEHPAHDLQNAATNEDHKFSAGEPNPYITIDGTEPEQELEDEDIRPYDILELPWIWENPDPAYDISEDTQLHSTHTDERILAQRSRIWPGFDLRQDRREDTYLVKWRNDSILKADWLTEEEIERRWPDHPRAVFERWILERRLSDPAIGHNIPLRDHRRNFENWQDFPIELPTQPEVTTGTQAPATEGRVRILIRRTEFFEHPTFDYLKWRVACRRNLEMRAKRVALIGMKRQLASVLSVLEAQNVDSKDEEEREESENKRARIDTE